MKELMVRPYLPRFLREGDHAEIRVVVNNAATAGTFKVSPATIQSMYAPEFAGYSSGATLTIGRQRPHSTGSQD